MSRNVATYGQIVAESRRQLDFIPGSPRVDPPTPLLVTGVTGVAGYACLAYFQSRFPGKVYGSVQETDVDFPAPDLIFVDLRDYGALERELDARKISAILDCAGNCALKACQLDPKIAWDLNVEVVRNLARYSRSRGIRLVHLSVDMVFGGREGGGYRDGESTCPVNVYGQTMAAGEEGVAELDPYAVTLRISMPMGVSYNWHAGAIDWIASRYRANRPATLFYDEVRTPTYVDEMARVFRVFLANGYAGVLNCGGPRQVSLYQMAQIINWTGGFERDLLFGQYREEYCPVPPRVSNCAMDSSKLTEILGFTPFSPWPALPEFWPSDRQWHLTRPDAFHGSTPLMNRLLSFSPRLYPAGADYYANLF